MPYRGLLEVYSVHWRHSQQPPAHWTECLAVRNACCTGCCLGRLIVVLVHNESLQLARLEKSQSLHCTMNSILQRVDSLRPDELIWLHAYMTGRVHALMPATHLQMSGRSMGTQLVLHRAVVISHQRGQESCH